MAKRDFPKTKREPTREPGLRKFDSEAADNVPELGSAHIRKTVGHVSGCTLLNIRSRPDISGEVVGQLVHNAVVEIDEEKSTDDWYFIRADIVPRAEVTGYCMRKYIAVEA